MVPYIAGVCENIAGEAVQNNPELPSTTHMSLPNLDRSLIARLQRAHPAVSYGLFTLTGYIWRHILPVSVNKP